MSGWGARDWRVPRGTCWRESHQMPSCDPESRSATWLHLERLPGDWFSDLELQRRTESGARASPRAEWGSEAGSLRQESNTQSEGAGWSQGWAAGLEAAVMVQGAGRLDEGTPAAGFCVPAVS